MEEELLKNYQIIFILVTRCIHSLKMYNQNLKGINLIIRLFEFIFQSIN